MIIIEKHTTHWILRAPTRVLDRAERETLDKYAVAYTTMRGKYRVYYEMWEFTYLDVLVAALNHAGLDKTY